MFDFQGMGIAGQLAMILLVLGIVALVAHLMSGRN